MKLVIVLCLAALAACDSTPAPPQISTLAAPEKLGSSIKPLGTGSSFFNYKNFYHGAFPPSTFPATNFFSSTYKFPTYNYPLKNQFNLQGPPQGVLPPISQIIPPQISQIVPPISGILPPIFGNPNPSFPQPSFPPAVPPVVPPVTTTPLLNKFTYPYYSPQYQFPLQSFPSTFSFPSNFFTAPLQKQPVKSESLSATYGPPVEEPVEAEPEGPSETSAPFEPAPVSFPYEPAAPDTPAEPETPHQPAQEYGLPTK